MIMLTGRFSIDPMSRGAFLLFAKGMVKRTQRQPGCLGFGIFEDISVPNDFIMLEQWESIELFDRHTASDGFEHDDGVLQTFIVGEPSFDEYEFTVPPELN
ncbi:MAG: antibiotic biosynthesis monooxygenase family protein [Anaerolineae bacterium]